MGKIISALNRIFFPSHPRCSGCGRVLFSQGKLLCPYCEPKLRLMENACGICGRSVDKGESVCKDCSENEHYFTHGFSMWAFENEARLLIHDMKFNNARSLCKMGGNALSESMKTLTWAQKTDIIISIPSSKEKLMQRGYNQAELIGRGFAEGSGKKQVNDVLFKVSETKDQIGLNRLQRLENMHGAFAVCGSEKIKDKIILLLDDVYTTGATVDECARVLLENGAEQVNFAALASTHISFGQEQKK